MDEIEIGDVGPVVAMVPEKARSWRDRLAGGLRRGRGTVAETATAALRLQEQRALQKAREQLARLEQTVEQGRRVAADPVGVTIDALVESRASRIAMEEANKPKGILGRLIPKTARRVVIGTLLEYANPWTFFAYGIGDAIAIINGVRGKDIYTGDRLDNIDRLIYVGGGLIPWAPASIAVEVSQRFRRRAENAAHVARMVSPKKPDADST